jgi:hypothetical protein
MNKFSGIDLHSNNSVVVVSDETDQIECDGMIHCTEIYAHLTLAG